MKDKIIITIGVILTGFVFWIGAGAPSFTAEDWQKIIAVLMDQLK